MTAQWDDRLISRERAYAIVADWPLYPQERAGQVFLDCQACGRAVTRLIGAEHHGTGYLMTPDGIMSAVLRHAVTYHDQSLSGGSGGGSGSAGGAGETVRGADPAVHGGSGGHPGHRPVDQEAGGGRVGAAAAGGVR